MTEQTNDRRSLGRFIASMLIFLGITLFSDMFALIVGRDFREGIDILPIVLSRKNL